MKHQFLPVILIAVVLGLHAPSAAQEPAVGATPETAKPSSPQKNPNTPAKVIVTVSRYQGDKKISSLPYSLSITIGGPIVRFRNGAQVPYATTAEKDGVKTPSYAYRDVGIAIDVMRPTMVEPGLYTMEISMSDSSLSSSSQIQGAPTISGVPIFRNFSTNGAVVLKDGQTTQLTTSADPITGETMRVDVMLTVIK